LVFFTKGLRNWKTMGKWWLHPENRNSSKRYWWRAKS